MNDFEQYVKDLGEEAQNYTPEQLQQLYADITKFAEILVAIMRVRKQRQMNKGIQK